MGKKPKNRMDTAHRAKQFMPFAALKGFETELEGAEFRPVPKVEFSEDAAEELDRKLRLVRPGDMVEVIYYKKTARGGTYFSRTGMVAKVDSVDRSLTIVRERIPFSDLYDIVKTDS
ncbi:MAG: YolD-like family protein [Clostridia bacterium]|nr:YolD-like family protein [Clostridia bacterium]MBP5272479.1 YolD-like family protein [Clostridia bacterium]MBP5460104.1 YolD-like family protein [Clostridia bacterium]